MVTINSLGRAGMAVNVHEQLASLGQKSDAVKIREYQASGLGQLMVTINLPVPAQNPPQLMVPINLRGGGVRTGAEP